MGAFRKTLGTIPDWLIAIIALPCLFVMIITSLGLFLQLTELVTGDKDFSKWMFSSIAEEPTVDLLAGFGISLGIFLFCIFITKIAE